MSRNQTWILKHPWSVRSFHYLLVLSFIPLAITGVALYFKPFDQSTMNLYMRIHVVTGVILTLDAVAYFIIGFDRVIAFIKRSFSFSANDIKWFSVLGGYPQKFLLKKKVTLPPMGKYNSGQKLFGVCVLIGGTILIATGWGLWAFPHILPHGTGSLFGTLHLVFGWILILFLLVHVFLGIYMFDDFKAMFLHGKIPYEEAKEIAPIWVERELMKVER